MAIDLVVHCFGPQAIDTQLDKQSFSGNAFLTSLTCVRKEKKSAKIYLYWGLNLRPLTQTKVKLDILN